MLGFKKNGKFRPTGNRKSKNLSEFLTKAEFKEYDDTYNKEKNKDEMASTIPFPKELGDEFFQKKLKAMKIRPEFVRTTQQGKLNNYAVITTRGKESLDDEKGFVETHDGEKVYSSPDGQWRTKSGKIVPSSELPLFDWSKEDEPISDEKKEVYAKLDEVAKEMSRKMQEAPPEPLENEVPFGEIPDHDTRKWNYFSKYSAQNNAEISGKKIRPPTPSDEDRLAIITKKKTIEINQTEGQKNRAEKAKSEGTHKHEGFNNLVKDIKKGDSSLSDESAKNIAGSIQAKSKKKFGTKTVSKNGKSHVEPAI